VFVAYIYGLVYSKLIDKLPLYSVSASRLEGYIPRIRYVIDLPLLVIKLYNQPLLNEIKFNLK
jgi:hypothetical protein